MKKYPVIDVFGETQVSVSKDGICVKDNSPVLKRYFWGPMRCRDLATGEEMTLRFPLSGSSRRPVATARGVADKSTENQMKAPS